MLEASLEGFVPANTVTLRVNAISTTHIPAPASRAGAANFVQPTPEISVSALKQDAPSRQRRLCSHHASLCPLISQALSPRTATSAPKFHPSNTVTEQGQARGKPHLSSTVHSQVHFQRRFCKKCTFMHITYIYKDLYIHTFTFLAKDFTHLSCTSQFVHCP